MTEEEKLRRLAEKNAAKPPMEVIRFELTEEERKEREEYIKLHKCPF